MKRENPLDALVIDNSPHCERFVNASALARDYCAGKYLFALFIAFFDKAVDINNIAYFEVRYFLLEAFALNRIQYFCFH